MNKTIISFKCKYLLLIYLTILFFVRYVDYFIIFNKVMDYEATFKNFFLHNYIIFAILAIIKITFTSFILLVGALIIGHKTKIKNYFKVTTLAYFIDFLYAILFLKYGPFLIGIYTLKKVYMLIIKLHVIF